MTKRLIETASDVGRLNYIKAPYAKKQEVVKQIEADLESIANGNKFNSLEKVKSNFLLVSDEFKEGHILTPTMKLRRKEAKEFFAEDIWNIYNK